MQHVRLCMNRTCRITFIVLFGAFVSAGVGLGQSASPEAAPGNDLLAALDFEGDEWEVVQPYNSLRRIGGESFPTVEQGRWHPPRILPRGAPGGAVWYGVPPSNEVKDRVESILAMDVPIEGTRYSAFDVRFPKDLASVAEDGWFLFHQWHQSSPESPPLALELKPGTNNVLMVSHRYTAEDGRQRRRLRYHPLPLGQWVRFVVKWRFDPEGEGEAVVWLDGAEVSSYHGRLGFSHVTDRLIDEKFGVYRSGALAPAELLYDNIRLGTTWDSVTEAAAPVE